MILRSVAAAYALIGVGVGASYATEFSLAFPVDCTLGVDCYIQNYVDHDPSLGFADFTCGRLGYDGHKGTDIAIANEIEMISGVKVRAASSGVVIGKRDGMIDRRAGRPGTDPNIKGRECGNGVSIQHPDGWQTQYCHLRRGSVRVDIGDAVMVGDVLGEIGLSGQTQFPHLDISVRKDGQIVDPFLPSPPAICSTENTNMLWSPKLEYQRSGWISAGFSDVTPGYHAVKTGTIEEHRPSANTPLVLWAFAFGAEPRSRVRLEIFNPNGTRILHHDMMLPRHQAQFFRAAGLQPPEGGWPPGGYVGHYVIMSPDGTLIDEGITEVQLP